jgi:ribosomal protein S20
MPHMHWVARQNKLELPNDAEEVNTRDIHKCDGQAHDPDTMAAPLTPKPTRKVEALAKAPPTIASRRKEDVTLKEVAKPRLCCANDIFETKTKDGNTAAKAPAPRTNPNTKEAPTAPKPHSHPSHEHDRQARIKSRVRTTSKSVMGEAEVQDKGHRSRRIREISHQIHIPTIRKGLFIMNR